MDEHDSSKETSEPERDDTVKDLDLPEEQGKDVKGGSGEWKTMDNA